MRPHTYQSTVSRIDQIVVVSPVSPDNIRANVVPTTIVADDVSTPRHVPVKGLPSVTVRFHCVFCASSCHVNVCAVVPDLAPGLAAPAPYPRASVLAPGQPGAVRRQAQPTGVVDHHRRSRRANVDAKVVCVAGPHDRHGGRLGIRLVHCANQVATNADAH